jgi:hypothetical protein
MNVMDRGFLYVGALSIAVLAGIAVFYTIEPPNFGPKPKVVAPVKVFVGTTITDSKECFVFPPVAWVSSSANTIVPNQIQWTPLGTNHSYTITFPNKTPLKAGLTVNMPIGQPSQVQDITDITPLSVEDFYYTVQNDQGCKLPTPAWVHVSK